MNVEKTIWSAYLSNPCRLYSIRELALFLKKSYPLIHKHMSRLLAQKKFLSKKVGKSILCYPNYNNSYALLSLGLAQEEQVHSLIAEDSSLALLYSYFSSQAVVGILSVWMTKQSLIIFLAHKSFQKNVEIALSKTTLHQNITFVSYDDTTTLLDTLIQKECVLFGFEHFHLLLRLHYEQYAAKHNLVRLHE